MKKYAALSFLSRSIVALVFIFSGFVKGIDPWGTAIKSGEYFHAFGMSWLAGGQYAFSVILSAFELSLGLCLLFRIRERIVVGLTVAVLSFFTLLTFVLALWNPVSDCGCFGDAIKLTNWQTFFKNIALLILSVSLWRTVRTQYRRSDARSERVENGMVVFFLFLSAGLGIYSLRHLPPIDLLPFRVGVNIPSAMLSGDDEVKTTLIYRDRLSDEKREFALTDTTWYDTTRWEYVDTRIEKLASDREPTILEFSIFDADGDHAPSLLASDRDVFLLVLTKTDDLPDGRCRERMEEAVEYAMRHGYPVVCLTTSPLPEDGVLSLGGRSVPVYNIDGTTLKTLIRARRGLVLLKEGTIVGKWNCRDIPPLLTRYDDRTPLETVLSLRSRAATGRSLGVAGAALVVLLLLYTFRRRK